MITAKLDCLPLKHGDIVDFSFQATGGVELEQVRKFTLYCNVLPLMANRYSRILSGRKSGPLCSLIGQVLMWNERLFKPHPSSSQPEKKTSSHS